MSRIIQKLFGRDNIQAENEAMVGVSTIESDILGITIIEDCEGSTQTGILSEAQWVGAIIQGNTSIISYSRLYFSVLKGIPVYLRAKIWGMICQDQMKRGLYSRLFKQCPSVEKYIELVNTKPAEGEIIQIDKDVHRSYSYSKQLSYTAPLMRKLLLATSSSGVAYAQGMNYILLSIIACCLESLGITESNCAALDPRVEFEIMRIFLYVLDRMNTIYEGLNIMEVMKTLEGLIEETLPEVLFHIVSLNMDCYMLFAQHYYTLMSYGDFPHALKCLIFDLFFLAGEKGLHAIIVRTLEIELNTVIAAKNPEDLQKLLKRDLFYNYFATFEKERLTAKTMNDFGLSFFKESK